uniref:Uncharacterized protein n=1 Tax=Oryza meridionalis TaxID=40149 RepID=A0A0E0DU01_9ORYZ
MTRGSHFHAPHHHHTTTTTTTMPQRAIDITSGEEEEEEAVAIDGIRSNAASGWVNRAGCNDRRFPSPS